MSITKEEIENLERALDNMVSIHKSMWAEYGSELCVGDMLKKENKLRLEIQELKKEYESGENN